MPRAIVPLKQTSEFENPESHVVLPMVALSDNPETALAAMRNAKRAAALATSEGGFVLLTAANIAVGRRSGASTLSDINPTAIFHPSPDARLQFHEIFEDPTARPSRLAFVLQLRGTQARLITGNAELNLKYGAGLRDLYCDGPGQHDTFGSPPPHPGDPCPYGDGYIVST